MSITLRHVIKIKSKYDGGLGKRVYYFVLADGQSQKELHDAIKHNIHIIESTPANPGLFGLAAAASAATADLAGAPAATGPPPGTPLGNGVTLRPDGALGFNTNKPAFGNLGMMGALAFATDIAKDSKQGKIDMNKLVAGAAQMNPDNANLQQYQGVDMNAFVATAMLQKQEWDRNNMTAQHNAVVMGGGMPPTVMPVNPPGGNPAPPTMF